MVEDQANLKKYIFNCFLKPEMLSIVLIASYFRIKLI